VHRISGQNVLPHLQEVVFYLTIAKGNSYISATVTYTEGEVVPDAIRSCAVLNPA
jgi:hypothetical protein